jgi:predicted nucleic acid-binding protein
VVDSSGWIEYFTESPNAGFFAPSIEATEFLVVASVSILEVFKWVLRVKDEGAALQAMAVMQQGEIVSLDISLALHAGRLGAKHRLPLADSIIYATSQAREAVLWTQDSDFEGLPGVQYRPKP